MRVEVRGHTSKFRDVLRNTYDLRWDKQSFSYAGDMQLSERRVRNLVRFCEKFNLNISIDGVRFQSSDTDDDLEDFSIEPIVTTRITDLGQVGTESLSDPKTGDDAPGYQEVFLKEDTEIDFDN